MLVTMKEILDRASTENYGVAAPNVSNSLDVTAAIEAAEELKAPIILDVFFQDDMGGRPNKGIRDFANWVRTVCEKASVPVAINEDHGPSFAAAIQNIKNGCTSVMVDRSSLPFEENVAQVAEIVKIAHAAGVSVEAELGHVGQADNYEHDRDAALTAPEDAVRYIEATGVDCLAVAIGTAHGAYPEGFVPTIDFDRLAAIKAAVGNFPLVLHGSSGTSDEDLYKVCRMGINKININTDLQAAGTEAVKAGGRGLWRTAQQGWKNKLIKMIKIYGSDGKAW